jgi:hypothetical protein
MMRTSRLPQAVVSATSGRRATEGGNCLKLSSERETTSQPRLPASPRLQHVADGHLRPALALYLGLIVAQCGYIALFPKALALVLARAGSDRAVVLALIDVVTISNLLVMYEIFVWRLDLPDPSGRAGMARPRQCERA